MLPNNIFDHFQHLLKMSEDDFQILDHQVPIETQMAYFKFTNRLRNKIPPAKEADLDGYEAALYDDPITSLDMKKRMLSLLASSRYPKAYRILEKYAKSSEKELQDWAHMALMESRVVLESELSDERQIYISTGLGGKGNKFRFYIMLLSASGDSFLDYQRQVIEREFNYLFMQKGGEIEELTIKDNYAELMVLTPIMSDIRQIITDVINECNQYGDFISNTVTLTNVKRLSKDEIAQILKKHEGIQASS